MSVAITNSKPSIAPIIRDDLSKIDGVLLSVTRSGTATRVNSDGDIELVAPDIPRIDYNSATEVLRGLLIEEARSNLMLYSAISPDGSPSTWTPASATLTYNAINVPDASTQGALVTVSATNGRIRQTVNGLSIGSKYAVSAFFKAGTISAVQIDSGLGFSVNADLSGGTVSITDVSPSQIITYGIEAFGGSLSSGWYRIWMVFSSPATSITFTLRNNSGSAAGTFYCWGVQLELCSSSSLYPTSYIPTLAAAVSRGADIVSLSNASDWFDTTAGTLYAEFLRATSPSSDNGTVVSARGTLSRRNQFTLGANNVITALGTTAGGTQAWNISSTYTPGSSANRCAVAFQNNDIAFAVAGAIVGTDSVTALGLPSGITALDIGHDNSSSVTFLNGHIRKLSYYDERLSNADLVTLTGGSTITAEPVFKIDVTLTDLEDMTGDLDKARILYHDLALTATITGSSEDPDYPADAAQRIDTYERWRPAAAALPATWQAYFGSAKLFDYLFIAAHDLGTKRCTIKAQYSGDGGNWYDASDTHSPTDDSAIALLFPRVLAPYARLYITQSGSPTEVPTIGVIKIGCALVMQRTIYGGHTPITLGREVELNAPLSKGGNLLAQNMERAGFKTSAAFRHLEPEWYRENFDPFARTARTYPFGFAWRPEAWPDEVAYCWSESPLRPSNMGVKDFMQVTVPMTGYDGIA